MAFDERKLNRIAPGVHIYQTDDDVTSAGYFARGDHRLEKGDVILVQGTNGAPTGWFGITAKTAKTPKLLGSVVVQSKGPAVFRPDIVIVGYGQSNWSNHASTYGGTPSPIADGTFYWDGTTWSTTQLLGALPDPGAPGDAVREVLNELRAVTGLTVGLVSYASNGVPISLLQAGTASFTTLLGRIQAAGNRAHYVLWHQGEGDSAGHTLQAAYHTALQGIRDGIATQVGKDPTNLPVIVSGLGPFLGADNDLGGFGSSISWDVQNRTLLAVEGSIPSAYYSHSNQDAIPGDDVHFTAPSLVKSGKRYAETIKFIRGTITTRSRLSIASATYVSATTTDVVISHSAGSDFTPTTGITGFEVSSDGGTTWATATGARQSATTIRLTHASLGSQPLIAHKVRYLYGMNPTRTSMVFDNSVRARDGAAMGVPLLGSWGNIQRVSTVATPSHTWDTDNTDTTPSFTVTGVQSGDTVTLYYGTALDFSGAASVSGTASGTSITLTTPALGNGTFQTRAKITRGGVDSFFSSTVQAVITGAVALKSLSFRGSAVAADGADTTTHNIDIGAASADRVIVVAISCQQGAAPSAVSMGGVALTMRSGGSAGGHGASIWTGLVDGGLNGVQTLSVTSNAWFERHFVVYAVTGASAVPKQTFHGSISGTNFALTTFDVAANDFLFAAGVNNASTDFTGSTEAPDHVYDVVPGSFPGIIGAWQVDAPNATFKVQTTFAFEGDVVVLA